MSISITMPRLSDTMEEGTLIKWSVKAGDKVEAGDHVADVETDKATMEVQAFDDGTVAKLAVEEGQTVPVGNLILLLAEEGESAQEVASSGGQEKQEAKGKKSEDNDTKKSNGSAQENKDDDTKKSQSDKSEKTENQPEENASPPDANQRLRVSPLAKKIAAEKGINLQTLTGSGPDGRIIKADVLGTGQSTGASAANTQPQAARAPAPQVGPADLEAKSIKLSNMRKTIARRLVESKTTIPHFTVTLAVAMDPLVELRKTLNDQLASQGVKLSVGDFITRAAALACTIHPQVNSSWNGDTIEQHGTVNVGIAVALPEEKGGGLVVPVLRNVQNLGLRLISQQTKALAKKARETGLSPQEMDGGTFTISNLGMFGVEHFEAIINPPQAAILAVGAAIEKPVVREGDIKIGKEMSVTISGDHRVIDGAVGAQYLQTLKAMLENPAGLLI